MTTLLLRYFVRSSLASESRLPTSSFGSRTLLATRGRLAACSRLLGTVGAGDVTQPYGRFSEICLSALWEKTWTAPAHLVIRPCR